MLGWYVNSLLAACCALLSMFSPQSGHFERCERPGGPSLLRKLSQALPFPERHISTPKWFSNDPKWFPIPILRAGRSYGLLTTRRATVWCVFTFYSVESRWKFENSLSLRNLIRARATEIFEMEKATVTDIPYINNPNIKNYFLFFKRYCCQT